MVGAITWCTGICSFVGDQRLAFRRFQRVKQPLDVEMSTMTDHDLWTTVSLSSQVDSI